MKLNVKKMIFIALSFSIFASLASCSKKPKEKDDAEVLNAKPTETEQTETKQKETEEPNRYETTVAKSIRNREYVKFGHYEQDGDLSNGPEPIEWKIVREEDGRMLLVSRYVLDSQPYNTKYTGVTWETCSLRAWLNNDFINTAFDASEQAQILTVTNTNPDNAHAKTKGGNDTKDKVFCLSVEEIIDNYTFDKWTEDYQYGYCQALMTQATQYAIDNRVYSHTITNEDFALLLEPCGYTNDCIGLTYSSWWLRSPGDGGSSSACDVFYNGFTGWSLNGENVNNEYYNVGVRPAIYMSVD